MEKICIKNMGVLHSFEKNETATMFFLKKTFSSSGILLLRITRQQLLKLKLSYHYH